MNLNTPKLVAPIAKRIAVVIIILCTTLVGLNVAANAYFNPATVASRELGMQYRNCQEQNHTSRYLSSTLCTSSPKRALQWSIKNI